MQRARTRLIRSLAQLEMYELVSLFILALLLSVFFIFAGRLHRVIGAGSNRFPLLSNIAEILHHGNTWMYLALTVGCLACVRLTRRKQDAVARQLHQYARVALTFLAILVAFDVINFYTVVFDPYDHDRLLRHLDSILFGVSPTMWFDSITCWPLTLLFCGAYASWFAMTYFSVFIFARHSEEAMHQYVTAAALTFYIGYITYFFVPAIGPVFTMHFQHPLGPLQNLVDGMGPFLSRDCFPSLHTGMSVIMAIYAWRFCRRFFWAYMLDTSLIILSTLYLRVHYGVDLIAGAALAIAVAQIAPSLLNHWNHWRGISVGQNFTSFPTKFDDHRSEMA